MQGYWFAGQDVLKNLLYSGEQYILVSLFSFVFSGCLARRVVNAARIVLFKYTVRLNNLSSDKKQLYNWLVDFQLSVMHQSIPSTNIPPRADPRGIFFKVAKFPAPGQKIFAKLRPRGKKIDKTPPLLRIFWTFKTILP